MSDGNGPVLVVQHVEPEGPGLLGDAFANAGREITVVRTDRHEPLPADLAGFSALVVMGGPMSAMSDEGFPSRGAEIRLLRDALNREIPTLGVCLGAQLLAVAGGATVRRGAAPEIGWGTIQLEPGASSDLVLGGLDSELTVLHWHAETFDLPTGAVHLASSSAYPHQAFRLGPVAWGLQFHVELDASAVEAFVDAFASEAAAADGGAAAILSAAPSALIVSRCERMRILVRFAGLVL